MDEVDWSSLHKTLSDTTRRSILELLSEKQTLSYTEIMTLLQVTNTGRLNYHLKALGNLISKDDDEGKYRLTERGRLAVSLLRTFPERVAPAERKLSVLKVTVAIVLILVGILLIASLLHCYTRLLYVHVVCLGQRTGLHVESGHTAEHHDFADFLG